MAFQLLCCIISHHVSGCILLIDRDLGFLFWLGRVLDQGGFEAFPAKSIPDAETLIREFHLIVGMLIVNGALPGTQEFIAKVRQANTDLKVIALLEPGQLTIVPPGVNAVCHKPLEIHSASKILWLRTVRDVFDIPVIDSASHQA